VGKETIGRLKRVPLFNGCTDKQLEFIASRVEELDFPSGKTLCKEGQSGGDFFIILSGTAEARRSERPVRAMGPGDFFGEIALVDNGPRTATVVATSPLRCLVLGPNQFQDVLYQNADIAVKVMHALASRLRATERALPAD
jgi:CRP/FNR family cyclic AMP-dependent transcriptional regulator